MMWKRSVASTLLAFTSFMHLSYAQFSIPYTIRNLGLVGPPGLNYTNFDQIRSLGLTWDIIRADNITLAFTFSTAVSMVELMQGPAAAASNVVVDVLSTHVSFTSTIFSFRSTLPTGAYHLRVSAIVNTTVGTNTTIQTPVARGADLHWTLPTAGVGCGAGLRPDPYVPVTSATDSHFTSATDSHFTSFFITQPFAGAIFALSHGGIFVNFAYRSRTNGGGQKLSSFNLQVVNNQNGGAVGAPISLDSNGLFTGSVSLDPVALGLQGNTSYKIRATYINTEQDGAVPPGGVVTYLSEEFNIVNPSVNCTAIDKPTKCPTALNNATISLIKQFEGFVPSVKPDPINLPTVGYGHQCQKVNCTEVPFQFPLSEANATALLLMDLSRFISCVNTVIGPRVVLNEDQTGALTSFTYNQKGECNTLKSSTLLQRLNNGEDPNTVAAQELPRFNKATLANGTVIVLPGLTNRRAAEVTLFQTRSTIITHPCV